MSYIVALSSGCAEANGILILLIAAVVFVIIGFSITNWLEEKENKNKTTNTDSTTITKVVKTPAQIQLENISLENQQYKYERQDLLTQINHLKKNLQTLSEENQLLKNESISYEDQKYKYERQDLLAQIDHQRKTIKNLTDKNKDLKKEKEEANQLISQLYLEKFQSERIENSPSDLDDEKEELETLLAEKEDLIKAFTANNDWRKQYPTPYRCTDGDWVRSKAEREIDNFFYKNRIWHIFEPEYYVTKNCTYYPDFLLPDYNLYIEYFGSKDEEYINSRNRKIDTYAKDSKINFAYLTYEDDNRIEERLIEICKQFSITLQH